MLSLDAPRAADADAPRNALWHRWFVQYNPMPIVSAALVLAGLWLGQRAIAARDDLGLAGELGVWAVGELYALALIGGAAVLWRRGVRSGGTDHERRSAVMLALLALVYQADPLFSLETNALLGGSGTYASVAFCALAVIKVELLRRALQLRVSRSLRLVLALGALTLALGPVVVRISDASVRAPMALLLLGAVLVFGWYADRRVRGPLAMGARGERAVRAGLGLLAAAVVVHGLFWTTFFGVPTAWLLPLLALAPLCVVRRERWFWMLLPMPLALAAREPQVLAAAAAGTALVCLLGAHTRQLGRWVAANEEAPSPYRAGAPRPDLRFVFDQAARGRLLVAAACLAHLATGVLESAWIAPSALLCVIAMVGIARVARDLRLALPSLAVLLHVAVREGLVAGALGWASVLVVAGFLLLGLSVGRARVVAVG